MIKMEIEAWIQPDVDANGNVKGGGAVHVDGALELSDPKGGCGLPKCKCSVGHWLCVVLPRDPETRSVEGITVKFENRASMIQFVQDVAGKLDAWLKAGG